MEEIRRPVLMVVAERSVSSDVTLQLMSKVSWDIKEMEVRSMHNQYVDILLRVSKVPSSTMLIYKELKNLINIKTQLYHNVLGASNIQHETSGDSQ